MASNLNNTGLVFEDIGKAIVIVNPVAQSGKSSLKGYIAFDLLRTNYNQDVDIFYTKHAGHAMHVAAESAGYDSVIVVGGDGVVHETALGLLKIPKKDRPILGVIPVGSGNDFARSLGMSFKVKHAVDQLMTARIKDIDVGQCNDEYFFETLSMGLDAGIAIDTMKARQKSKEKGFKLYFKCGLNRIKNNFDYYDFEMTLDGKEKIDGNSLIMAIQIGRTYGGGFQITPEAKMDDGYFDICYTQGHLTRKQAFPLFARAAKGKHVNSKYVKFAKAKDLELKIKGLVPCQMDGEEYSNMNFKIKTLPKELKVYFA